LIAPSQPSNRVDKIRHKDTMKIRNGFIRITTDMDVPVLSATLMSVNMISSISTEAPAAVRLTKWRNHGVTKPIEM
jgi:hypothetical protein